MRYTLTTRVNIESAPYDPADTAAEMTDSIFHWITDGAYARTDPHFGHNAVTVDSVTHAETQPRDEALAKLREVHARIAASEQEREARLEKSAADAEERADYYDHDSLSADMNEDRAEALAALLDTVRDALGVI